MAEAIGILVQPWAAFFERIQGDGQLLTGTLIERIHDIEQTGSPTAFVADYPQQVAQFLVWTAFQRLEGEDPEFVLGKSTPLKVIDLDSYGPHFRVPLETTDMASFVEDSVHVFNRTRELAAALKLEDVFAPLLIQLLCKDPTKLFNFSGHPEHATLQTLSCDAFRRRGEVIRRILA